MCSEDKLNHITAAVTSGAKEIFGDKLKSVILYGSYARGDYDSESDIDLMVLVDLPKNRLEDFWDPINKIASRLSLESEECTTVSIHEQDTETFDRYLPVLPFFQNVRREGVLLYDRT
jgi:predicted nucleotidyltransferase